MIRAVRLLGFNDPPLLEVVDVDLGPLAHGEARLRLLAAEVLPLDLDIAAGRVRADVRDGLQPGVTAIAEIIEGPNVGTIVAVQGGAYGLGLLRPGTFAEQFDAPTHALVEVPPGVDPVQAAAAFPHGVTARLALTDTADLRRDETVLITAATGGVGRAAVAVALASGARVLTASRTPRKADAIAGVTQLALHELESGVRRHTDGAGVDVIIDLLGGEFLDRVIRCGADHCRHVLVGHVTGQVASLDLPSMMAREHRLLGFNALLASGGRQREATAQALDDVADGTLRPRIAATYDLDEIAAACSQVGGTRVVLVPER